MGDEVKLGAYAVTEPQAGSDVKSLRTTAKLDGDEWVLSRTKVFISNGGSPTCTSSSPRSIPSSATAGVVRDREGNSGPAPGQEGVEARYPRLAHRRGRARGLPDSGREPARRDGKLERKLERARSASRPVAPRERLRPSS